MACSVSLMSARPSTSSSSLSKRARAIWPGELREAQRAGELPRLDSLIERRLHKQLTRLLQALATPGYDRHRLRLLCKPLGVIKLDATSEQIVVQFDPEIAKYSPIEPIRIIELIQNDRNYRLAGQDKLALKRHCPTLADRVSAVEGLLRQLTKK